MADRNVLYACVDVFFILYSTMKDYLSFSVLITKLTIV